MASDQAPALSGPVLHSLEGVDGITFSHSGHLPVQAVERIRENLHRLVPAAAEAGIPILILEEGAVLEFHRPLSVEIKDELRILRSEVAALWAARERGA